MGMTVPDGIDPSTITAIGRSILKLLERIRADLKQGELNKAILEFMKGKIMFSKIEGNLVMIITSPDKKLGDVRL